MHALTAASAFAWSPAAAFFWIPTPHAMGIPQPVVSTEQSASFAHLRCASMYAATACAPAQAPYTWSFAGGDSVVGDDAFADGTSTADAEGATATGAEEATATGAELADGTTASEEAATVADGATGGRSAGGDSHAMSAAAANGPSAMIPNRD